ncbi:tyrosine-protein phosphatase non-receptor type 22-like [Solea senegalensis]|uniref:protein-tyrosine-phosphatase n=1 Tax=Solea senegalensis TaxID=28829 RepID=A0AAV6SRT8_SOLSE|nr:tyrosine-protein phosphatase non-receptor type 22 isoform X1 [Solea senegalensis]XP_043895041.1 tyrosine-protein phosphatase non-receptor type 22 isoform X1 [Solea senegalensis]KAG7519683.1 tyrosine-protein phosphatase non-receptor type 22-like [Solea senegalensis]
MEQQAWILRSFLVQLERQEAVDEEEPNGFAEEFARLKSQSFKYRTDRTFPTNTGEKQENTKKNRYKDIVPFDHSRVKLTFNTAKHDTDYINANFIKGVSDSRAYVATQGPLPHTLVDFFRMIWEYNIQVVVMVCREFEMGKKKSERYWPQKQEQPFVCDSFTVHCDSEENKGDYLVRMLRVTYCNCSRTLKQLHYVNWPDHGVPDTIHPILEMLHEMRSYQAHDDIPICIHCSAGCGRTGALCAIDYTWNLLRKQMITPDFNIYNLVQNMRTQRPSVVQTKEQYKLVCRTIKLLFQRYLESLEAPPCKNEVTMTSCTDTDWENSDLCQELVSLPQSASDALPQHHAPSLSISENLRGKDKQTDRQQRPPLQVLPDSLVNSRNLQEGPSQRASAAERSTPASAPLSTAPEAVCHMVEDPYFKEVPVHSTGDTKQWTVRPVLVTPVPVPELITPVSDEDTPPPLPERTPESYILAVDTEQSDCCDRLSVVIPSNAAAEAVRELRGSPPSPVPPLPERTPESYELAIAQARVGQHLEVMSAVNPDRTGTSSEWSGNSKPTASASHNEAESWARSKSLKANMTVSVPVIRLDLASNSTADLHPVCLPVDPPALLLLSHTEDSPTPSLPAGNPEAFILKTVEIQEKTPPCLQPVQTTPRVGMSSEWNGNSQSKKFPDVVMSRSKSVRARSSRQEPLTAVHQLVPPPVVVAGAGSAQVARQDLNRRPSLTFESPGSKSDRSNDKGITRTKSLKFFRHKQKPKLDPPPPPDQPAASTPAFFSVFNLGFGNRFGKPKGPRGYPESWTA